MLYSQMTLKTKMWVMASLGVLVILLCWRFMIEPHEIKRLQRETADTALKLRMTFLSKTERDLMAMQAIFSRFELDKTRDPSTMLDDLNEQFKNNHGLESITFSSVQSRGSIVLFNPYTIETRSLRSKHHCDKLIQEHPNRVKTYKKMTVIPLDGSLCVYDSSRYVLAIFNLKTTLEEYLQNEIMKGYFVALSDKKIPEWLVFNWKIPLVHQESFYFFGAPWSIKIYPSKAYVEVSVKRVFMIFCSAIVGFIFLFGGWFLKYRWEKIPTNARYVNHLKRLALYDTLTELPNRRHCLAYLNMILGRSNRGSDHFSVCFLDCNKFKKINDKYGHYVGDLVLKYLAHVISQVIRQNDFFARFAGDEFCLILSGAYSDEDIQAALNKIFEAVSTLINIEGHEIIITLSIGVAVYPESGQSADLLLKHADEAMYAAKRKNKTNAYVVYCS